MRGNGVSMRTEIFKAAIIPWEETEDLWGVAIKYSDGRMEARMIGTRAEAEADVDEKLKELAD